MIAPHAYSPISGTMGTDEGYYMDTKLAGLLERAFSAYAETRKSTPLEPDISYLSYDFNDWHISSVSSDMVRDQLNEFTNIINGWQSALRRWHAWNLTLEKFPDDMEAWEIRIEFLQPLVHTCLLEPSAVRDKMVFVAINSFHQLRLASDLSYPDHLVGDPTTTRPKPRFQTRPDKETQLQNLIKNFPDASAFMAALQSLDDDGYKRKTSDYRNRSSHALAPRIELGLVETITRKVVPATQLVQNSRGTFDEIVLPNQMRVRYGIGGTTPLNSEEARTANMVEFMKARRCYALYRQLLVSAGVENFSDAQGK